MDCTTSVGGTQIVQNIYFKTTIEQTSGILQYAHICINSSEVYNRYSSLPQLYSDVFGITIRMLIQYDVWNITHFINQVSPRRLHQIRPPNQPYVR